MTKADLIFQQETHMPTKDQFRSNVNSKARGVSILIFKSIQFSSSNVIPDKDTRYLIISATLSHVHLLVNIYAPNFHKPHFMNKLLEWLPSVNKNVLVYGGDINWNPGTL